MTTGWESCPACSGFGYIRKDGSHYTSASQRAQGQSSRTALRCSACSGTGARRVVPQ